MYEKLENCPACGSEHQDNELICKDYLASQESFVISKCQHCGLLSTNPRPTEENAGVYYKSKDYISHHSEGFSIIKILYRLARTYTLAYKVGILQKLKKSGKLLDIGCGEGSFLNKSKNLYSIHGVEKDQEARKKAENECNIKIPEDVFAYSDKQQFDLITMWHVLEHVYPITETLKQVRRLLKKDGFAIIAVPNIQSYDAQYFGNSWAAYDVPRHLYHFNKDTFKSTIAHCKLSLVDTKPLFLDSYYISILSRTRIERPISILESIKIGYKSNQIAKKTGDYSSLIYILQRK